MQWIKSKRLSVDDIANYFLAKAKANDDGMSNMKLQKLIYYAQGFHLAIYDKPLFPDNIIAWEYGPVVPSLYHKFKDFGSRDIEFEGEVDFSKYPQEVIELLDDVFEVYGQYSAWKLSELTHSEPPYKDTARDCPISQESMKVFFKKYVNE